ncbi:MAG: hypothetical protein A2W11_01240 [Ignavibacteria bacterium RBG_16_35_7]|nr:MAG: hypothetical protein A2W11_01240 [Ignavibacteria bacterium RBG_16_35_7]
MNQNKENEKYIEQIEGIDYEYEPQNEQDIYPIGELLIRTETRTIFDIKRRIDSGYYILNPSFQRDFVWDEKKQSKLIESVLMRLPLPVFYFAETSEGKIIVVDGLQRLKTFSNYMDNKFKLKGLEKTRPEIEGKLFQNLSAKYQARIEDTNLTLYLIDPHIPERVRLDIFERVNSGIPLSRQQMRNSLYMGKGTEWLRDAAISDLFQLVTDGKLDWKTMRDRELINRFCAFKILGVKDYINKYKGDMEEFLSETLKIMNQMGNKERQILKDRFDLTLTNNYSLFEKHSFRKHYAEDQEHRSVINASLFDVFTVILSDYSKEVITKNLEHIREGFYSLMNDEQFNNSITISTNSTSKVKYRFGKAKKMIEEAIR